MCKVSELVQHCDPDALMRASSRDYTRRLVVEKQDVMRHLDAALVCIEPKCEVTNITYST